LGKVIALNALTVARRSLRSEEKTLLVLHPESAVMVTEKYDKTIILRNIVAKIIKQNTLLQIAHHSL
jgi:hypothetical protein